jgi:uncharacterized protein YkwD
MSMKSQPASTERVPSNRSRIRLLGGLAAVAVSASVTTGLVAAPAATASNTSERQIASYLNSARHSAHRRGISGSADLNAVARAWAQSMASHNTLAHNPRLTSQVHGWRYVGENVGVGATASSIHRAFMASRPHRANILDVDYTQSGIGVVYARGRLWVVEVFRQPASHSSRSSSATLHYGSRGSSVKRLQRKLHVRPTGFFGRKTRRMLKAFQHRHHLPVTGTLTSSSRRSLHL